MPRKGNTYPCSYFMSFLCCDGVSFDLHFKVIFLLASIRKLTASHLEMLEQLESELLNCTENDRFFCAFYASPFVVASMSRTSLQGRNTKVAVVLIQKKTPLPPGQSFLQVISKHVSYYPDVN